jgi:two-component system chemotaxis sensor kinase CheA
MLDADEELIAEFTVESLEGLAGIEQQLLAIEAGGVDVDVDLVNAVFRTMHSIKGTSGFLGLSRIGSLAHALEEVLNHLRNREIGSSSELVTQVLHAADFMKNMIEAVATSNEVDVSAYVQALQAFRPGALEMDAASIATPVTSDERAATVATPVAIETNAAVREFLIECYENLDQMDQDLLSLEQNPAQPGLLRAVFRTMHTIKGGAGFLGLQHIERLAHAAENLLGKIRDGQFTPSSQIISVLVATVNGCRAGLQLLEAQGTDAAFMPDAMIEQITAALDSGSKSTLLVAKPAAAARPPAASATGEHSTAIPAAKTQAVDAVHADKGSSVSDTTIRVDVALLDKLMTRVGELVLARNQILQYSSGLENAAFLGATQRLNLITAELQESVMKTRMQPIGNVWAKFPRVVRDLASQLGKQVAIDMEGKETELDKTIVEAVKDPLTHLVRNSVDHGIEAPAVRQAAGKPMEGRLSLRAYHEGGQVNIEITDDGAGLNFERIRRKAVERGLLSADHAARLSDRDAAQLIFAPGFSTAENVTSVSGRGVGMDVVKTHIERISGTIDLESKPGHGTTVRIKIPLTLAIIPALVVGNDGDRYAIPQVSLLELVRLEGEEAQRGVEYVHGAPVYRLRGKLLPLVYLSERLQVGRRAGADDAINIVVLQANDRRFGLVVDKIHDAVEIVVKPLSRQLKGLSEYAGATIMGDGTVALILDVKGLALSAGLAAENRDGAIAVSNKEVGTEKAETLLIVDLGDSRRFALPTSMVSRLEQIAASSVEKTNGREVIQYRGAIVPLVRLSDVFGGAPSKSEQFSVVVYTDDSESCAFVVGRIVDVVETEVSGRNSRSAADKLLGTAVIQQCVTDIVNLPYLAAKHSSLLGTI